MEQVFDFREFLLSLAKKMRLVILLGAIFLVLGGGFGIYKAMSEVFVSTASANVNIIQDSQTVNIKDVMANIDSVITGDYYYTGILESIKKNMDNDGFLKLFSNQKEPKIRDLKEIIKVYTQGNLVLIDVTASDGVVAQDAAVVGMNYLIDQIPNFIKTVVVSEQGQHTINLKEKDGDTIFSQAFIFGILGLIAGIAIGVLSIFFVDIFDLRIKSKDDLKQYKLPILGEI